MDTKTTCESVGQTDESRTYCASYTGRETAFFEDRFEFSHRDLFVRYYRARTDSDPVFRREKLVRVSDMDGHKGYVHAQSLADCVMQGRVDASRFFAERNGPYRRAVQAEPDVTHALFYDDFGPMRGAWLHPRLIPAFAGWVRDPGRAHKRYRSLAEIKDELAAKMDGVTCVRCRAACADVVSYPDAKVVVIEDVKEWARGLGRLAAFAVDFGAFRRQMHLYCTLETAKEVSEDTLRLVDEICRKADVDMTIDHNVTWALEDQTLTK